MTDTEAEYRPLKAWRTTMGYNDYNGYTERPLPSRAALSIRDVERLSKAGVRVDYKDVQEVLVPDPPERHEHPRDVAHSAAQEIYQRWDYSLRAKEPTPIKPADPFARHYDDAVFEGVPYPPFVAWARPYKETMHVFIAPTQRDKFEPVVLHDDIHMYPSDALMAKIHLLLDANGVKDRDDGMEQAQAASSR